MFSVDTRRAAPYNFPMEYEYIQNPEALLPHMEALTAARVIAVDLETTGLDPHTARIRLVQLAMEERPVLVIDCFSFLPEGEGLLREALSTAAVKVFQNAKFDLSFLEALSIRPAPLFDTMLASRLLYMPGGLRRANLEALASHYLGETLDKTWQKSDFAKALTEAQLLYAARDAEILLRLRRAMIPRLVQANLTAIAEIEFACVRAVAQIEHCGIAVDPAKWDALIARTEAERDAALTSLYSFAGRPAAQTTLWGEDRVLGQNFDSNAYVLALLSRQGIHVKATAKGDLYPYRDHPLVQALKRYRKAAKALSAILLPARSMLHPVTGRLHPQYGQISAYSGRMSCANPNIQQIPREAAFRACFAAPEGKRLVIADYSQIELRVAAQMAGDARMLAAYRQGEDLHTLTASLMRNTPAAQVTRQDRQAAKAVNFGLIYGMGASGLKAYAQQSYGVDMTLRDAELFRARFFAAYPGIARWHRRLKDAPPKEGRTVTGRRFPVSQAPSVPELSNAPVQGTAADILKKALGMLAERLAGSGSRLVAVVHDEILLECPEDGAEAAAALLRDTMEAAGGTILPDVPVVSEAKVALNWAEK